MLGSLDHVTRQLIVHTSPTKRSSDFVAHLEQLDRLYGPKPGQPTKPVVLVEDNGPIHTSKLSLAALAARAHWLTVEWLPKNASMMIIRPPQHGHWRGAAALMDRQVVNWFEQGIATTIASRAHP